MLSCSTTALNKKCKSAIMFLNLYSTQLYKVTDMLNKSQLHILSKKTQSKLFMVTSIKQPPDFEGQ